MTPTVMSAPTQYAYIICTPAVVGGEPRIEGHRIRVRDIAAARDQLNLTPERIVTEAFPSLTLAEVYSALAYFEEHRDEMESLAAAESQLADEFQRKHPDRVIHLGKDGAD